MNNIRNKIDNCMKGYAVFTHYIPELPKLPSRRSMKIRAIFRDDGKNADANIYFVKNRDMYYYHDFVNGEHLNPFGFIKRKEQCDNKIAFYHLRRIEKSIGGINAEYIPEYEDFGILKKEFSIVVNKSYDYWFPFAPKDEMQKVLDKFGVLSLENLSFMSQTGKQVKIKSNGADDPIFAFPISDWCYKVYRPNAMGTQPKHLWLGNKPADYPNIYGVTHLPDFSEYILIVEGLKDAIVSVANGVSAVGVDNVATIISLDIINTLKCKCKHLLVCYDIDDPGLKGSEKVAKQHGLGRLLLPAEISAKSGKDISDFFRLGHKQTEITELINNLISRLENPSIRETNSESCKNLKLSKLEQIEAFINEHYELRYNVVSNLVEYRIKGMTEEDFQTLNENNIYRNLQHNNIDISINKLKVLLGSDFVKPFHPFKNYLENLPEWVMDKDPDYIELLSKYIPATNGNRFAKHLKKALVRTVACGIDDKKVNKQAFVLVGEEQNTGKSTFINWLIPPELHNYQAENISTDKDSLIALCENLIINLDELTSLSKVDINGLKNLFSREKIKIRRPYDRSASSGPRRASFFGSTNRIEFLTDETGSVRWLCFELKGKLNWDYAKDIDINNIWRQAYWLYKTGFKYELTNEEIIENELINQQYQISTSEIELIQSNIKPGSNEDNDEYMTATDILNYLSVRYQNIRFNITSIGRALKILGFERKSLREGHFTKKVYYIIKND